MRKSQILLILLGVIILGVGIIVGMVLTEEEIYDEQIKDLAVQHINVIGGLASKYFNTPAVLGGGSGSFDGFSISDNYMKGYTAFDHWLLAGEDKIQLVLKSKTDEYKVKPYRFQAFYRLDGLEALYIYEPSENQWIKIYDRRMGNSN